MGSYPRANADLHIVINVPAYDMNLGGGLAVTGYYGTEAQKRLQALVEASADFIDATALACQTDRTMGCDDPNRFGSGRVPRS